MHRQLPRVAALVAFASLAFLVHTTRGVEPAKSEYAEIRVIDAATGRGVPLVELETVNYLKLVTDNAERVAFSEPGLMNREVFFSVHSHGYDVSKDGFGLWVYGSRRAWASYGNQSHTEEHRGTPLSLDG